MNLRIKQVILIIAFIVTLVSCKSAATQTAPVDFIKTLEPTITPTIAITKTASPTSTLETKIEILDKSTSPDGVWIAVVSVTTQGTNKHLLFEVTNSSSSQKWNVIDDDLTGQSDEFIYPYVFQWSNTGKYLYFSNNFYSSRTDTCLKSSMRDGVDMFRLDLETGKTNPILVVDYSRWMAFSPSEKMLAYVDSKTYVPFSVAEWISVLGGEPRELIDFDRLLTKNDTNLASWLSYIFWSPDEEALIYTQLFGTCDRPPVYTSLIRIDLATEEQTILVDYDAHGYTPVAWNNQDKILLQDNEGNNWWLNPITKEITPAQQ